MGSSIPLYRSSEEEKRVTVIKAPHYPGIGPVDESGIPTAIRTVGRAGGSGHPLSELIGTAVLMHVTLCVAERGLSTGANHTICVSV